MEFTVPYRRWTTVLDAILEVKKYIDHSVAVRYSCRQATCGSCGMIINGRPRLACFTKISELDSDTVTVEPMKNFPIIRDLAVRFDRLFEAHRTIKPFVMLDDSEDPPQKGVPADAQGGAGVHPVCRMHKVRPVQLCLPHDGH